MTFNKFSSLDSQKKAAIAKIDHGVSDHIELEIESPLPQPNSSKVEEVRNINHDHNIDESMQ